MELVKELQKEYMKKNIPDLRAGDVIKVSQKIKEGKKERIQIFEGIIIKTSSGKSLDGTFTVRRKSFGVGVEITFPLHSPVIVKIQKIKHINVRRARIYYLRDITEKQIRSHKELAGSAIWEEASAEEEEEKIRAEKEAEAKLKAEKEAKEQAELEKKFAQTRGEEMKDKIQDDNKEEKKDDDKAEKSGK